MTADSTPTSGADATRTAIGVSVVIAAHEMNDQVAEGLQAHHEECGSEDEIIVVVAGSQASVDGLAARFPGVRVLSAPARTLTPRLWSLGLTVARAPLVRVTIGPCRPAPGWRRALLGALGPGVAAVGGAIEPGDRLRARDQAIYALRYRNYRLPFDTREGIDLPGDHAAYLREALMATRALWRDGFWEMDVNRALAAARQRLILEPRFVSHYVGGEGALRFLAQRFRHGIHFGRSRLEGAPAWRRWAFAATLLLPGLVFLRKILREASGREGRRAVWTLASFPWLVAFVTAWALGEWVGTLQGPPRPGREAAPART